MKLTKNASGGSALKVTRAEWESIGKRAGWGKEGLLPSERFYHERGETTSDLEAPSFGEERFTEEKDPEEAAILQMEEADKEQKRKLLDALSDKAGKRLKGLLDEVSVGGVDRQEALTRASDALRDIIREVVYFSSPPKDAIERLRAFMANNEPHAGVSGLKALVSKIASELGATINMPSPEEFKGNKGKDKEETVKGNTKIKFTREAWTKIGKRTGWLGTDKMKAEQAEETGKLVVQIPGGKESEVEFSYTLTLKPHDKTNSPTRSSVYKIVASKPKLSEKEMEFAHEQIKKWMKEHGAENAIQGD